MITILRKHHRWLMIVIAILAIPFIFYFNKSDFSARRITDLGVIYNRPVTQVEFTRNARYLNLAGSLELSMVNDLMVKNVSTENEMYAEFTWNRLVLRHEAERLGIHPTAGEIAAFVKTLARFKGDSGFDSKKYDEFTSETLPSLGFKEAQLEEVICDQLILNRVKDLIGTGIQPSEIENKENYDQAFGKLDVAVVRLRDEDFAKDVKIADEEITKTYDAQKDKLKSDEKRKVEFVQLKLSDEEKNLAGKERIEALQKLADRANEFSQALLEKDANFGEVAKRFEVPVITTGEFTPTAPDPQMGTERALAQYSFQLTEQAPISDPVQGPDGFTIIHLLNTIPSHPLTLEEARPRITESLKAERTRDLVSKKAATVSKGLGDAFKAGTSLEKVAEQNAVKFERIPTFTLLETPAPKSESGDEVMKAEDPTMQTIKSTVAVMKPGEVSGYVPADKGAMVIILEKRSPADPNGFETAKAQFEERYLTQRRAAAFLEWLRERRREAGVAVATG